MNRWISKVPFLFWGLIPLLLIYILFTYDKYTDINIHDTYFVLPQYFFVLLLIVILFVTGLGYYLAYYSEKFKPIGLLTIMHIILFFIGLIILIKSPIFEQIHPAKDGFDLKENLRIIRLNSNLKFYATWSFLTAQILFLMNLTISIFRRN
ncbi:hypothetical protein EGM88_05605 [Aureibaculum marinum]|uniref:DUF4149 domain-containing protein n=1 Tax=Aureibaculum marinum TaxID=2487930 RepID=A0A3N4NSI3_9FLAO|nr:hypothetical protein [Aureibaculum marinum]RPD98665.1 hypothetical protein EGM88_05605 [Aureibaculum marinum]